MIGKIADGNGYAYTHLECERKNLSLLKDLLREYKHLRKINFAFNKLTDVSSITWIPYLTHLNL